MRLLIVPALALSMLIAVPAWAGEGRCYSDWSDAGPIVRKNDLTPATELPKLARSKVDGDLAKITLCEEGGTFVYKLVFFDAAGQVINLTVDAKNPFP